jgi:hypothetical protein
MSIKAIQEIEDREGKPIRDVLIEKYQKHGVGHKVAKDLGISPGYLSTIERILHLRKHTVLVPDERYAS